MSSHREAPGISKDPVADSTDLYAFTSPDHPGTVTLIANYIPLEGPDGGPNFYSFGDDVLYEITVTNGGTVADAITYRFEFTTEYTDPNTFLYNTGPITSLTSSSWNVRQFYSVTRIKHGTAEVLASKLACPPVNVGVRSTPNYSALAQAAVHPLDGGWVFAGQRREGFYVDLGSIFDLGVLRPFQNAHLIPLPAVGGVDSTKQLNVHTIAIQIPKTHLTRNGAMPTDPTSADSVIGVYTTASRRKSTVLEQGGHTMDVGPWVQVSRLGMPLVNEVIIPIGTKDFWNSTKPRNDAQFVANYAHPELAGLLPVLYPGVFPHLAAYTPARVDLEAILLTGIPSGIIPGFQNNTGSTPADLLRLNMAIPPASSPSLNGILGGDLAGFPNGRRVFDDVATIEIRAIAGATIPLVDPSFSPDGAAGAVSDFSSAQFSGGSVPGNGRYIDHFPYLGTPLNGFNTPS
ncbi:MAG: DUF4331 domain-containing protein [Candidatus Dormiibacterota bacterium]